MAKAKKNWRFHLLKSLFSCESKSNSKPKPHKEKSKGWRWIFGRLMLKQLPTTPAPKSLSEAREEQRKHAMNVAKATAAAAEAAVAAAQAAAEVVRLTGVSRPASLRHHESQIQNLAAVKIQTAFRGYIARKALRALKGVVRIQALARGRAVRRRVRTSLKNLPSKHPNTVVTRERNQTSKLESKSQRHWSDTLCSKEEFESVYHKRQEAVIRRERMKQYSFSHRERQYPHISEETTPVPNSKRHTTCLRRQWAPDDNLYNFHPSTRLSDHLGGATNLRIKPRNSTRQRGEFVEEEVSSPFSHPRRSFCHLRPKTGGGDDSQLATSPSFPAYMAATESARAKMRSMSTPRQRLGYLDTCFEQGSWSSFNGEVSTLSSAAIGKSNLSQSKSSLSMGVFHYA